MCGVIYKMDENKETVSPIMEITKVNVSKETFHILLDNIMNGTWKKGEKIPSENELKEMLKVSRHTIRSAIANLNMLGILETKRGDGNYVKANGIGLYIDFLIPHLLINKSNVHEVVEFREGIEIAATRYAAVRATQKDLDEIGKRLRICKESCKDLDNYPHYDLDFHSAIVEASKNDLLIQSMNVVKQYCFGAIQDYFNEALAVEGTDYHQQVYNALLVRDADAAVAAMTAHMHNILKRVN